jgi:tetratricopeptide (TPR) repeat protein
MLVGRDREREVLDRLLDGAIRGRGGALVVHGEPGVGKTALLDYAINQGRQFRVARTVGVESDMELAFAALQQLCSPFLELMYCLPAPQRDALGVAFGLSAGRAPDPFLVGLAILGLLAETAEQRPLLCVVDDAQWLDSASARALAFAARRLLAERITVVFGTRKPADALAGLPSLQVEPLGRRDSRALLESVLVSPVDDRVLERIVTETGGNPLALLELPRGLTPAQLAGGFGFPAATPLPTSIERGYARQLTSLTEDARRLLLVAAADPVGDPALLSRAAERLGISEATADTVELEDLLALSPRVAFRHPLVRSAVYRTAGPDERREVHQALAAATDPAVDPDRRAWHRAQAVSAPDEEVAAQLERSAARAQARGGFAAAVAFLDRSVALTPEPRRRARRALAAVQPSLARATYLEALSAATFAGRLAADGGVVRVSEAALADSPRPEAAGPSDLLLLGLAVQFTEGYAAGAPVLKQALSAFQGVAVLPPDETRWLWFASWVALFMWDDAGWAVLSTRHLELVRQTGALSALPFVLTNRSSVYAFLGELGTAASLEDELKTATEATGIAELPYGRLSLAALRGREAEFSELTRTTVSEAQMRGEGLALTVAEFLSGVLYNGLGRYDDALAAALPAEPLYQEGPAIWTLTELIEAAVRSGHAERARSAFERVQETTCAAGTDWALGIEARSRALLTDGAAAEDLYREAIDRLSRTSIRVQLARTHLLYGEWLRRERRRLDARAQLRTAHEMFRAFGVEGFAERARVELQATGERAANGRRIRSTSSRRRRHRLRTRSRGLRQRGVPIGAVRLCPEPRPLR